MIEDLFPFRVDVANREGLKAYVRPSAERAAIYASKLAWAALIDIRFNIGLVDDLPAQAESKPNSAVPAIGDVHDGPVSIEVCYTGFGAATPMTRDEIIATLRTVEPALRAKGVKRAALFGSRARGEARPDSDIDIMVEIDPDARVGVWGLVSIMHLIEDRFPHKVDVSERDALRPFVRPTAERDAIYAF